MASQGRSVKTAVPSAATQRFSAVDWAAAVGASRTVARTMARMARAR
jgi:hypothetical protein